MGRVEHDRKCARLLTWANGCGIFTSISGCAPNRIFNLEWHAVRRENGALTANFEVRLYENDPNRRFDLIYGVIQPYPGSLNLFTAGVQRLGRVFLPRLLQCPPAAERVHHVHNAILRHPNSHSDTDDEGH